MNPGEVLLPDRRLVSQPVSVSVAVVGAVPILVAGIARLISEHGQLTMQTDEAPDVVVVAEWQRRYVHENAIAGTPPKVLITGRMLDADALCEVVSHGVVAILPHSTHIGHVLTVAEEVANGKVFLPVTTLQIVAQRLRTALSQEQVVAPLTRREAQLLGCFSAGHSSKDSAKHLGISVKTVENIQLGLYRKLGVTSRAQAVALNHKLGLSVTP